MRRLRLLTTVFIVLGLAALLSFPFAVGQKPERSEPIRVRHAYAVRLTVYFAGLSLLLLAAASSAALLARRIRRQFQEEALRNLADLLSTDLPQRPKGDGRLD